MATTPEAVIRFEEVSFEFGHNKPILDAVNFSVRRGSKITLMGQNGAGKSTIFGLITGAHHPESGQINIPSGLSIATSRQVIPRPELTLTVREFFEKCFKHKVYDIDPRIDEVLEVVNLSAPHAPRSSKSEAIADERQSLGDKRWDRSLVVSKHDYFWHRP